MRFRGSAGQWLWAIVVLGAALRFVPIWFGLPYLHARPDEEVAVFHSLQMRDGDLNPHFFHWPSLTFYLFAGLFAVTSAIRRALSLDPTLTAQGYFLLARCFVALAGTLTIVVLFRLCRRIAGVNAALLAALFLSVALLHVRDSHFAMTDVLMTFLVTLSLAVLLHACDAALTSPSTGARWWFALAGLLGGLAASTKYSAAAIVAAMAGAQLVLLRSSIGRRFTARAGAPSIAFMLGFAIGFLAGTPYSILDFRTFENDVRFTMTHLSAGHGVDLGRGWFYHLRRSLPYGLGFPTFIAALIGIVPLVRYYGRHAAIILAFALAFYVSVGSGQTVFFRYVLPLVPIACLSAGVAVSHMAAWLASRHGYRPRVAVAVLTTFIAAPSLVNSLWFDALLAKTDTRVIAARWLEERLTEDTSLHDGSGPYSQLDLRHIRFHQWYFNTETKSFGAEGLIPEWLVLDDSPLRLYVGGSQEVRQLARQKYILVQTFTATRGRSRRAVYDQQDAFFLPFWGFHTVERPGPTILIYRRSAS